MTNWTNRTNKNNTLQLLTVSDTSKVLKSLRFESHQAAKILSPPLSNFFKGFLPVLKHFNPFCY